MKTNDEKLKNLIDKAKKDKEFIRLENYVNSFILVFDRCLYSDLYQELKSLDNLCMIFNSNGNLFILIYKIKKYEID